MPDATSSATVADAARRMHASPAAHPPLAAVFARGLVFTTSGRMLGCMYQQANDSRVARGAVKVMATMLPVGLAITIAGAGCKDKANTGDEIDRIKEAPAKHYGKEVTLVGEVESVKGPRAFKLESTDLFDEEILVLSRSEVRLGSKGVADDDKVRVTGTVRPLSTVEIERELGWDLDPQLEMEFNTKPVVVARSVALADRPDVVWNEQPPIASARAPADRFGLRPG